MEGVQNKDQGGKDKKKKKRKRRGVEKVDEGFDCNYFFCCCSMKYP